MTALLEFAVGDDSLATFEIDSRDPGVQLVSRNGDTIARASAGLEQALSGVQRAAEAALEAFKQLRPDVVEIEFGVKLSAAAGAVIAKCATEGHLQVKLVWTQHA